MSHALYVDLLDHHLARQRESLALSQQAAVLIDEGIASEDDVLRGLAEAAGAVDVGRDGACALLREERLQIGVLAHELVAGGEVEDDVGTGQGQLVAGGSGRPDVLAHLDAEEHVVTRAEELCLGCELYGAACKTDFHRPQVLGRSKPALFVELAVVGQVGLRHDAQQLSTLDDGSTVEQQVACYDGQSDNGDDVELAGEVHEREYCRLGRVEERGLGEQVLAGVARDRQLGEYNDFDALSFGLSDEALYLLHVVLYVANLHCRHGGSHLDKSVLHKFCSFIYDLCLTGRNHLIVTWVAP